MNKSESRKSAAPPLTHVIYGFVLLGAIGSSLLFWFVLNDRLAAFQESVLIHAVEGRGRGAQLDFARSLHHEWAHLRSLSRQARAAEPQEMRSALDTIAQSDVRSSWAAIIDANGVVTSASGGVLEGWDLSDQAWFQRAVNGPVSGEIAEAPYLPQSLAGGEGSPNRFIHFAMPLRAAGSDVAAVAALLVDVRWARTLLEEMARALQLDLYLIDRTGKIQIATDYIGFEGLDLRSLRSAQTGVTSGAIELWGGGRTYVTTVLPNLAYRDLPPLGWSLLARISSDALSTPGRLLFSGLLLLLTVLAVLAFALTLLFTQLYIRPFSLLAASATRIADGQQEYPYESRRTRELILLCAALARLQTVAQTRRRADAMSGEQRMSAGGQDRRQGRDSGSR